MAKFRLRSKITGQYVEITQEAVETPVEDLMGYFEGKDVETVLSEIGMKIRNGVATPHDIDLVRKMLDAINDDILSLKDGVNGIVGIDTETLKEMVSKYEDGSLGGGGSGGGGSLEGIDIDILKEMIEKYLHGTLVPPLVPTIETTFPEKTVIEQGDDVTFDIYFQTPNLGDGTLYIVVNNAEIDFQPTLIGGDNNITIKGSYLTKANNSISVYAKDRVGMTSNRITFTVIAGLPQLVATDTLLFPPGVCCAAAVASLQTDPTSLAGVCGSHSLQVFRCCQMNIFVLSEDWSLPSLLSYESWLLFLHS